MTRRFTKLEQPVQGTFRLRHEFTRPMRIDLRGLQVLVPHVVLHRISCLPRLPPLHSSTLPAEFHRVRYYGWWGPRAAPRCNAQPSRRDLDDRRPAAARMQGAAPLPLSPAPLPVAFPPRHPYLSPIDGGGTPLNPPGTQNGLVQLGLCGGFAPHNPYFVAEYEIPSSTDSLCDHCGVPRTPCKTIGVLPHLEARRSV